MFTNAKRLSILLLPLALSCSNTHNAKAVRAAMHHYDHLILTLDGDGIAKLYTEDGELGNMARGRDSIRKFLAGFSNMKVLSQASTTDSLSMQTNTALQKGNYKQTVIIASKDTVTVTGQYIANWQWIKRKRLAH